MKNIHNIISDAFDAMNNPRVIETDYIKHIVFRETPFRTYEITIKSKNTEFADRSASLHLILNQSGNLEDYTERNDLFINDQWDLFCVNIENHIEPLYIPNNVLNQIAAYIDEYHAAQDNELEPPQPEFYEPNAQEVTSDED
jgi:hypothetical protein